MQFIFGQSIEITDQLSPSAAATIAQWIGCATVIYNQKTVLARKNYADWVAAGKPDDLKPALDQTASFLTKELAFLKDVPCQIRRNAAAKWFEAATAGLSGLRKFPVVRAKHKRRSCYVTKELFHVQALDDNRCLIQIKRDSGQKQRGDLIAGVIMPVPADAVGSAFYLSRQGRRFWFSMSYREDLSVMSEADIKALIRSKQPEPDFIPWLNTVTVGFDRGIKRQVNGSDGVVYHLDSQAQAKIKDLEAKRVRYQKRYARRSLANDREFIKNYQRAHGGMPSDDIIKQRARTNNEKCFQQTKIAPCHRKVSDIKRNHAHHASKAIVASIPLVGVFEDLNLKGMSKRPKAKQDENGRWLRNGARRKAGLNKALLGANLGQIGTFTGYKAKAAGKLIIKIDPKGTSQECSECGYTHADNRLTQEWFSCLKCGHRENADDNAAKVIKKRGIELIGTEAFSKEKTVRKLAARKTAAAP